MTIDNREYKFIDFDFVEIHFASVLRLPGPMGSEESSSAYHLILKINDAEEVIPSLSWVTNPRSIVTGLKP